MKLHIVAGSDILNKGLDPSFPHSRLGEDGLLVIPTTVKKELPGVSIPEFESKEQTPVDVPVFVQESIDVSVQPEQEVKPLEIPAEEEKKHGKNSKSKKSQ
jgi:hypothetical protein